MCCQLLLEAVSVSSPHVPEAYEATGSLGWPCVSCRPGVLCSVSPLFQADGPVWALPRSLNTHRLLMLLLWGWCAWSCPAGQVTCAHILLAGACGKAWQWVGCTPHFQGRE